MEELRKEDLLLESMRGQKSITEDLLLENMRGQKNVTEDLLLENMRGQKSVTEDLLLESMRGQKSVTADGWKINLYADIENADETNEALENDAEGIGLLKSEFLYSGRPDLPSVEEQVQVYRRVLRTMAGKKVIIRTLDIGADHPADCFFVEPEENPMLGYQAIRICLSNPEIFETQLCALLQAAPYGTLAIMYPMIISVEEMQKIHSLLEKVRKRLKQNRISYAMPEQGILIETPAAVMICEELAEQTDFFCIGTNRLAQYTLAADRKNARLKEFYNPCHPALLRMIRKVTDCAHRKEKWVGICGDLASDPGLTETFVEMGVDELSAAPSMILKLRQKIRAISAEKIQSPKPV